MQYQSVSLLIRAQIRPVMNVVVQGWPTSRLRSTGWSPSVSWSIAPDFAL